MFLTPAPPSLPAHTVRRPTFNLPVHGAPGVHTSGRNLARDRCESLAWAEAPRHAHVVLCHAGIHSGRRVYRPGMRYPSTPRLQQCRTRLRNIPGDRPGEQQGGGHR